MDGDPDDVFVEAETSFDGPIDSSGVEASLDASLDVSDARQDMDAAVDAPAETEAAAPTKLEIARTLGLKIVHLMLENRTVDSHWGAYTGANTVTGNPRFIHDGNDLWAPGWCVPDAAIVPGATPPKLAGTCVEPYEYSSASVGDRQFGALHDAQAFRRMMNKDNPAVGAPRLMNGFCANAHVNATVCCDPVYSCSSGTDVMGYQPESRMAPWFALMDRHVVFSNMHESMASWSEVGHYVKWSEASMKCGSAPGYSSNLATCVPSQDGIPIGNYIGAADFPWTTFGHLLAINGRTWRAYSASGGTTASNGGTFGLGCSVAEKECPPVSLAVNDFNTGQNAIWFPFCRFTSTTEDGQLSNCQTMSSFYSDAAAGTMADLTYISPGQNVSDHPTALVSRARKFALGVYNSLTTSPLWAAGKIVLVISWDDGGGFFDHAPPPADIDYLGVGLRTPFIVVSPRSRRGFIDRRQCTLSSVSRLIEDLYAGSGRLPGDRPDNRPIVASSPDGTREGHPLACDLLEDLDFDQALQPSEVLPQ